ncbi:M24 family metallopeptidase [Alkalibacterium pelagium]|nr:Xaa-Pro aminopeptidase [Alkalibacterium pelagium]
MGMTVAVVVKKVKKPEMDNIRSKVMLTDETIQERLNKVLERMKDSGLSSLVIYADKEHGSSFEYLVGFIPRFEEALLVLNQDGSATLILGNENINKAPHARLKAVGRKCALFSLPNQPMGELDDFTAVLQETDIDTSSQVGLVGWKLIPGMARQFDIPQFIVSALETVAGKDKLVNATALLVGPENGARVTINANEAAHYEYGAALASDAVLDAMNSLTVGVSELEMGNRLNRDGQYNNVVTICAFGDRFIKGNLYPTDKRLVKGDKVALTVSYKGGLSSRSGYAVTNKEELNGVDEGYLEEVVVPYFEAYHYWLTNLKIGLRGGDFYDAFNTFYPQDTYGWHLCPGHLTADEEWLSSPFYKGSEAVVQSGMLFQVDFIPSQPGHNGVSAESTVLLADDALKQAIRADYPDMWKRIESRRAYLSDELGIKLSEDVLPMAGTLAYYRPYMLNDEYALTIEN